MSASHSDTASEIVTDPPQPRISLGPRILKYLGVAALILLGLGLGWCAAVISGSGEDLTEWQLRKLAHDRAKEYVIETLNAPANANFGYGKSCTVEIIQWEPDVQIRISNSISYVDPRSTTSAQISKPWMAVFSTNPQGRYWKCLSLEFGDKALSGPYSYP